MGDFLKGSTKNKVDYVPGQVDDIGKTLEFKKDVVMPAWKDYMNQTKSVYDQALPGMNKAAQGGAGYAGQVGQTLGETGEAAARGGTMGLLSFNDPNYGKEQFAAAMAPIQGQYQQNLANQGATFGGAGNLGSSREALAQGQLASAAQGQQMQAAANVMNNLNQQRLQANQALMQGGGNYLQGGLGAKQAQLGFAERPMDWQSTYGKQLGMMPSQLYTPQYPGQASTTQTKSPGLKDIVGKFA